MKRKIWVILTVLILTVFLSSCELIDEHILGYEVVFYHGGEIVKQERVKKGGRLTEPEIELDEFHVIDGWFISGKEKDVKWDFSRNVVEGPLTLIVRTRIEMEIVMVENITLEGSILSFEKPEDTDINIKFKDYDIYQSESTFDLAPYKEELKEETEFAFDIIGEKYVSVEEVVKIKYSDGGIIESYKLDFIAFDTSDIKEINRQSYKSGEINLDDHHITFEEVKLTNANQQIIDDVTSLILRKDANLELKEGYKGFESLEFNLSGYDKKLNNSTLDLLISNDGESFEVFKSFEVTKQGFDKKTVTKDDIAGFVDINETIYFRFEANIVGSTTSGYLIIDNITIFEKEPASYTLLFTQTEDFELLEYYQTVEGLEGKALVDELRTIISTNLNPVSYKDIKIVLEFADINPDNEDQVIGIYDRRLHRANWGSRSEWHREHVWPNSRLGMDRVKESEVNQGSDPHNLRAITPSTNSSRSNRFFDNKVDSNPLGHTIGTQMYYPGDEDKGDVARILMYMVIRYEILGLTDHLELLGKKAYTIEAAYMGLLTPLLDWHNDDPVDDFERYRNDVIYEYQNNRNPFIDHPELFVKVYQYLLQEDGKRTVYVIDFYMAVDLDDLNKKHHLFS